MSEKVKQQVERWRTRPLEDHYLVLYIDALFMKVRRAGSVENESFYTVLGLKERGVQQVDLIVADGLKELEETVGKTFPRADFQKCVTHLKRYIINKVRKSHRTMIGEELKNVFRRGDRYESVKKTKQRFHRFIERWEGDYPFLGRMKGKPTMDYYFTYLNYDHRVQSMIYTTNWLERLHKEFRRVLKIRNVMANQESVLTLLASRAMEQWKKYKYPIYNFRYEQKFETNEL